MRQPDHHVLRLPSRLLEEIRVPTENLGGNGKVGHGLRKRKEQRKAARIQKKRSRIQATKIQSSGERRNICPKSVTTGSQDFLLQSKAKATSIQPRALGSRRNNPETLKRSKQVDDTALTSQSPPKVSRATQERLAADDAEIAALEKALGVRGKKQVPKSFKDDGLDSLLEGIDDAVSSSDDRQGKRKRCEEEAWLERKRQKSQAESKAQYPVKQSQGFENGSIADSEAESFSGEEDSIDSSFPEDNMTISKLDEDFNDQCERQPRESKRENPYIAPIFSSAFASQTKYNPPLTHKDSIPSVEFTHLRRRIQGLINRLSEANLTSILGDIEKIYADHPRQHVTGTLLDTLMRLLASPDVLQDTFIILHAGLMVALYKVVGTDFGAQAIQRIDEIFAGKYAVDGGDLQSGKTLNNLLSLLAVLYNFHAVNSRLIYDYIRLFLEEICEINTELLLKVVRLAGPQLRQDDPSSLRDIVLKLQAVIAKKEDDQLSVRTKFMIETINNLKNNRMKTGVAAATITSEHMVQMKKTLGALNTRSLKASEPLRVGLRDLRDRDKKGVWWLVGASFKGNNQDIEDQVLSAKHYSHHDAGIGLDDHAADLLHLAREQRMNTDVRRSIFIAIMSSTDFNDAFVRLKKLRLRKTQELEIPKVLIQCAGAESTYNPFYTHLSRRLCSDKKIRTSFRFSLWDLFKRLGEGDEEVDVDETQLTKEDLGLRSLVNLAKMFGVLIAEGGLDLGVLKSLNLALMQAKTSTFVEMLLVTAILQSQRDSKNCRNEAALIEIFMKAKDIIGIAGGLQYFLRNVVRKTDVTQSKSDKETILWACRTLGNALKAMAMQIVVDP